MQNKKLSIRVGTMDIFWNYTMYNVHAWGCVEILPQVFLSLMPGLVPFLCGALNKHLLNSFETLFTV